MTLHKKNTIHLPYIKKIAIIRYPNHNSKKFTHIKKHFTNIKRFFPGVGYIEEAEVGRGTQNMEHLLQVTLFQGPRSSGYSSSAQPLCSRLPIFPLGWSRVRVRWHFGHPPDLFAPSDGWGGREIVHSIVFFLVLLFQGNFVGSLKPWNNCHGF